MWKLYTPSLSHDQTIDVVRTSHVFVNHWNTFHPWRKDKKGHETFKSMRRGYNHHFPKDDPKIVVLRLEAASSPPGDLLKRQNFESSPQTFWIRIHILTRFLGCFLFKLEFEKTTDLVIDQLSTTQPPENRDSALCASLSPAQRGSNRTPRDIGAGAAEGNLVIGWFGHVTGAGHSTRPDWLSRTLTDRAGAG